MTTTVLARQSRNQKNRNISRKDAKAAKKKKKYLSELSVLGALAGGISESEMFRILENLPKPRNFSSIVVRSGKTSNFEILHLRPPFSVVQRNPDISPLRRRDRGVKSS